MDVRCDKCSEEYEFEDSRIPSGGLNVKCSSCGHIFRVHKPGEQRRQTSEMWMVKQPSGNSFEFKELTTLQRWIVERKVHRDDQISKTGKNWKRLGDIAELAAFFQVVESANANASQMKAAEAAMSASVGKGEPAAWEQDLDPPTNAAFLLRDGQLAADQNPRAVRRPSQARMDVRQPTAGELAHLFPPAAPKKRRWPLLVVLLLLGGGGAAVWVLRPDLVQPWLDRLAGSAIPELANKHLSAGDADLRRDTTASITSALDNYDKAIQLAPQWADARAGLAEVLLVQAENLADEAAYDAEVLEKVPPAESARLAKAEEIGAKRALAEATSQRAFDAAKEAVRLAPNELRPNRAMADYYRFKRAADRMEPLVARAKAIAADDGRLAYVLGSLASLDAASYEQAQKHFAAALERHADDNRARYKLAATYAAQNKTDQALVHLETILEATPDHARAKMLRERLVPPAVTGAKPGDPPPPPGPPDEKEDKGPVSFDTLISRANRLRQADKSAQALKVYERAMEMQPDSVEAVAGMGWAYFDMEQLEGAISMFKRALVLAPRYADAHMGLAESFRARNMKRDAVKHYREFLTLTPSGPDADLAKRMLQQMEQ